MLGSLQLMNKCLQVLPTAKNLSELKLSAEVPAFTARLKAGWLASDERSTFQSSQYVAET